MPYRAEPAVPEVVLNGYPVGLGVRQHQRKADLMWEFRLLALDDRHGPGEAPTSRLVLTFADSVYEQYG